MSGFACIERLAYGPWPALERMLARLVEHGGFQDVSLVGGSGDNGADVVATFEGQRWVLQAKFRASGGADSLGARDAVRALASYRADVCVAATNTYFTQEAFEYAALMDRNGVSLRLWDGDYLLAFFDALPDVSVVRPELRAYQSEAVERIELARSSGAHSCLVAMATGLGKSVVAAEIIMRELGRNPDQEVLVLAHTRELVRQLERSSWPQLPKDIATHLWTDGETPAFHGGVVFATWQSLLANSGIGPSIAGRFGLVIVDEAHHAPSDSFKRLLNHLRPNFMLGLTATPWRGDERSLAAVFGQTVFAMDIVEGLQEGYLADVDYRMLTDGIDWDEIARLSRQGHTLKDLNMTLVMPDRDMAMVELVATQMASVARPRVLGFCRSIEHATRIQALFAARGVRAAVIHGGLTRVERFEMLSAFRFGTVSLLLSVELLNEGIDVPDVNMLVFMRVTHSRRIFVQQLGRGLRLSEGKPRVLVLDFVADIRRIAAGIEMNSSAIERAESVEVLRYRDGRVIRFDNDAHASFFAEYLADVASLQDLGDGARLQFPDTGTN